MVEGVVAEMEVVAKEAALVVEMAAARGIDMPIAQAVHAVISGLATVDEAIEALLARPLRAEL